MFFYLLVCSLYIQSVYEMIVERSMASS